MGYSTEGDKFCFALNKMPIGMSEVKVFITSRYNGSVMYQIQSIANGFNESGTVTNETIARTSMDINGGVVIINSTQKIQVVVFAKAYCSAAFLAVPQIQYETNYKHIYTTFPTETDASLMTVACINDMRISYEGLASFGTSMHAFPNLPISGSAVNISDFTVLRVEATQAIGLMTSHECTKEICLINNDCVEHITEQIPPSYTWGYNFFVTPFQNISRYKLKVWQRYEGTNFTIYCNGKIPMDNIYNTRKDFDLFDDSYCCIQSNQPFAVMQFANFNRRDNLVSVWIAPISQYLSEHTFTTDIYENLQGTHYITVTVLERYFNSTAILLDTNPLESNSSKWFSISCSSSDDTCGYSISMGINMSNYTVKHIDTNASINVIVYGWFEEKSTIYSYAYPAGFGMNPIGGK